MKGEGGVADRDGHPEEIRRHSITLWQEGEGGGSSFRKTIGGPYKLIIINQLTTFRIFRFLLPLPPPLGKLLENT